MRKISQERGSITLFVVISMLFFVLFLAGIYMITASKQQTGISETARIKEIYERDISTIDDAYETIEKGLKRNLKDVVQIGDYVAYDPTAGVTDASKLTYTSPVGTGMSHGNGLVEQTFTAKSVEQGGTKWRVLSKNEQTGEIVLISDIPILTDANAYFYMSGEIGYLYAEQELNEICKIYGYGIGADTSKTIRYKTGDVVEGLETGTITGSGARSITVEDIDRAIQYNPTTFTAEDSGITYRYGDSYSHTIFYPSKATQNGISTGATTRSDTFTAYWYKGSEYIEDGIMYDMLFGENKSYYLASRCVSSTSISANFFLQGVNSGEVKIGFICGSMSNGYTNRDNVYGPVRLIVYLKSDIQTMGKDESGAWIMEE